MLSTVVATALLAAVATRLPRLARRYDGAALAPIAGRPDGAVDAALTRALQAWVADGAGSGATPLPWLRPTLPQPLSCARVPAGAAATVRHFGYHLAGYHQLDARSRLGGILYRLGVQLRPLLWFLPRRADEPWDDAWLSVADEGRLAALARWLPRRPTLIVLDQPVGGLTARVLAALSLAARRGEYPVRVLVLDAGAAPGLHGLATPVQRKG